MDCFKVVLPLSGELLFGVSVGDRRGQRSRLSAAANFERERERENCEEDYGKFLLV